MNVSVLVVAAVGVLTILYCNRSIGGLAGAFSGEKDAVARS